MMKKNNCIVHPRVIDHKKMEVSAGAIIKYRFPYILLHPKNITM